MVIISIRGLGVPGLGIRGTGKVMTSRRSGMDPWKWDGSRGKQESANYVHLWKTERSKAASRSGGNGGVAEYAHAAATLWANRPYVSECSSALGA